MNKSEMLFERWCMSCGWPFEKIAESKHRTPDYKVTLKGRLAYFEVKEILANEEEAKVAKQLIERGWSDAYGEEPGKTVRQKIKESYPQLKRSTEADACSGVLVLYNNNDLAGLGRADHYHVLTGMFGLQTVPVYVPRDPGKGVTFGADYFGPKKSVTKDHNRYLSAIMTLYESHERGLIAHFYHNPYCRYPISPGDISNNQCIQYRKSQTEINWEPIAPTQQGDAPEPATNANPVSEPRLCRPGDQ